MPEQSVDSALLLPPPAVPDDSPVRPVVLPKAATMSCFPAGLRRAADRAAAVVRALLPHRGANVLVCGAAGTGKTFLAAMMARRIGLVAEGFRLEDDNPMASDGRIAIAEWEDPKQGGRRRALLIAGAENWFQSEGHWTLSEALSGPRCVRFWLLDAMPKELPVEQIRLFDACVEVPDLSSSDRARIWRFHVRRLGLDKALGAATIADLAGSFPVGAGTIVRAVETVARLHGGRQEPLAKESLSVVRTMLASQCALSGMVRAPARPPKVAMDFGCLDESSIRSVPGLQEVVETLERHVSGKAVRQSDPFGPCIMSVLLSGPSGSGKTRFAGELAKHLGLPLRRVSAGDVIDSYVGATERNLKKVFEEAEAAGEMLFFDEADGLLQSRERADRQPWIVTQVNELLVRMETYRGIMVFATNLAQELDPAVLRRFTFKIEFGYLTKKGRRDLFQRAFHTPLTSSEGERLDALDRLTPGDFRTVCQSLRFSRSGGDNRTRLDALAAEASRKPRSETWSLTRRQQAAMGF